MDSNDTDNKIVYDSKRACYFEALKKLEEAIKQNKVQEAQEWTQICFTLRQLIKS